MITSLRLQQFRSYTDKSLIFTQGVNIIAGPNASGKTNILEAVLVLAKGHSYRTKDAVELIQFDKDWTRLDCQTDTSQRRSIKIETQPTLQKTYSIDSKKYTRLTAQHTIPVVLFEPNHLHLLHGGPDRRRDYLDDLLEQLTPKFGSLRRQYKRVLAQRNRLLKQVVTPAYASVFPWDVRLSELAGQIVVARQELCMQIHDKLPDLYGELSQATTNIELQYKGSWSTQGYETSMLKKLETNFEQDRLRGFTSYGPHREDFLLLFDGKPGSETASRGEVRTALLGLKLIELDLIHQLKNQRPLLLLDDVFGELDERRRQALTSHLVNYQTFITTTDADISKKYFASHTKTLYTK